MLLKSAAWAAPAVAVAVASPAASASTAATVNLALESPQAGSNVPLFTPALTERFEADQPYATVIVNTGTTAYSGPIVLSIEVDRRLYNLSEFTYDTRNSSGPTPAAVSGPVISGNRATYTVSFAATIAAGTDPFTGVMVRAKSDFLGAYPNDTFDPADASYTWLLLEPNDDANPADNVRVVMAGEPVSSAPFGGAMTAQFEEVASGGGTAYRPTSATLTSIGPNPIAAGDRIAVRFAAAIGDSVEPQGVTLNGASADGLLAVSENTSSFGWRSVQLALGSPLAAGDVVAFTLAYTGGAGGTPSRNASQISYSPADPNSPDRRGSNVGYVNQPGS